MQRMGFVLGIDSQRIEEYKPVHQEVWPETLVIIGRANITSYSIFTSVRIRRGPPPAGADRGARAQGGPARSDPARACPPAPSRGRCRSARSFSGCRGWCCS